MIAHVNKEKSIQTLDDHSENVSFLSGKFASKWNKTNIGKLLGIIHDIGKSTNEYEQYIRGKTGLPIEKIVKNAPHTIIGAQHIHKLGYSVLGFCVEGHHGGMPDLEEIRKKFKKEVNEWKKDYKWQETQEIIKNIEEIPTDSHFSLSFFIRMMFSCLVDADFLDTEKFMNTEKSSTRDIEYDDFIYLRQKLHKHQTKLDKIGFISEQRNKILEECIKSSKNSPGFFSMSVPTGGGKTLSSMFFALNHAIKNKKERIIYVIPYTSIIEQTSDLFRDIFGEKNILEHHCNIDNSNKLSTENWDVPIITTTNVQFFESLFSNMVSKCRKLHNIANSVIVLDESHKIPPKVLKPTKEALEELVKNYGCSVVFCSATHYNYMDCDVREIISNPKELHEKFRRVKIRKGNFDPNYCETFLCIVNTKKSAKELYKQTINETGEDGVFHLSTNMCPKHRNNVFDNIKKRLNNKQPCKVISTQLIECGVNISFSVVFRVVSGINSIIQAAGRCNRERENKYGEVIIFECEENLPRGNLRKSRDTGKSILKKYNDIYDLDVIRQSNHEYYNRHKNIDEHNITEKTKKLRFREISKHYKIIEDKETELVMVPYDENAKNIIEEMKIKGVNRYILRKLQKYGIEIYRKDLTIDNISDTISDIKILDMNFYYKNIGWDNSVVKLCKTF